MGMAGFFATIFVIMALTGMVYVVLRLFNVAPGEIHYPRREANACSCDNTHDHTALGCSQIGCGCTAPWGLRRH